MLLCGNVHVDVGDRDESWLNVRETRVECMCVVADMDVNVGVSVWMWLSVREYACDSVCELFECERVHM